MEILLTHLPPSLYAVIFLAVVAVAWRTYGALTNPLAHLPGPTISKWTNLRFQLAVMTGERTRYEHALHERYGPVVRISPYEVSLASPSAAKMIYQIGSPFLKTPWYNIATGNDSGLFTLLDPKAHAQRRRLLAHNYSESWIKNMEPYIAAKTHTVVSKMSDQLDRKGFVNVNEWFWFMSTDVISEAAFGESFDLLKIGQKNDYIRDLEKDGMRGILRAEFPLLEKVAAYLFFGSAGEISEGQKRMKSYAEGRLAAYWNAYRADPENVKPTLLTKAYAALENGELSHEASESDARTNIIAGTDTTAGTATYAVWFLSQNPKIEQALIREVSALPTDFNDEQLRTLPLLDAVIKETLRLRPSVGQGLPRAVPVGGVTIEGHYIPAGTTVAIPAYSMHRIKSVWPEPEKFNPSRWENVTRDMKDSFVPFGGGSRVCIGQHFAQLELRHALANFYRTFSMGMKASEKEGFKEEDMMPMSFFVTALKGGRCLLERREKAYSAERW